MTRNIPWDESLKENALTLLESLLSHADDELDDSELKDAVFVEWVTDNRLRVTGKEVKQTKGKKARTVEFGTRKEHLVKLVKNSGKSLKLPLRKKQVSSRPQQRELDEVQYVLDCFEQLGMREDEKSAKNKGYWKFILLLKHQTAREENLEVFQQKWKEHPKTNSQQVFLNAAIQPIDKSTDWRNICRDMLEKQKSFTTNRLMRAEEMVFNINDIDVPLALVKRKPPDKRFGDDNPKQSQLYEPEYEETEKLEYQEFITKVLKSEQSKKIAIIGEPGAGKTTLLQKIAFKILEENLGLPIWISLGNLPTPTPKFQDYLLNHWLQEAVIPVTPKHKAEFTELITAGKVWLFLDGVDEIAVNSGNPLKVILDGFKAWSKGLRLVLSCRLNIWEANPFLLDGYQTYRTLQFSQDKVNKFIKDGFQKSNPTLGIELQQALNQPGKERIKDLVKNPLRLMLLCSNWHLQEGNLPDTKAELYQQFIDKVYGWKEDEFPTTTEERKQLNAKLKELALAGIDNANNRFCLPEKFIENILGEKDDDLFQLALKLGWLNSVGVDEKNPNLCVYAFYHPTFQEYFAALAIEDWDFFLPREHDNNNPQPVSDRYRIFEPQWKEVILLWLGREKEQISDKLKEEFINELVDFNDGCKDFYNNRAYYLAAAGICEFKDSLLLTDKIVRQMVKQGTEIGLLQDMPRTKVIDSLVENILELVEKLQNTREEFHFHYLNKLHYPISILAKIGADNEKAIKILDKLLNSKGVTGNKIEQVVRALNQICTGEEKNINILLNLLESKGKDKSSLHQEVEKLRQKLVEKLRKQQVGKLRQRGVVGEIIVNMLVNMLIPEDKKYYYYEDFARTDTSVDLDEMKDIPIINSLLQLLNLENPSCENAYQAVSNQVVSDLLENESESQPLINILEELIGLTNRDDDMCFLAEKILDKIEPSHQKAIEAFEEILSLKNIDNNMLRLAAEKLGQIDRGNQKAIDTLIKLLSSEGDHISLSVSNSWEKILIPPENQLIIVVKTITYYLKNPPVFNDDFYDIYEAGLDEILSRCSQNMTYPAFYEVWHQPAAI